ncbi:UDP-glucose 4-epimerase GalE [Helicobacter winghamensis]|uniref:UDP-glucose 4-epimerase n=1 Tax=Helicobacter winghamensis TaxID=157268 RepID=A0A2N3PHT3_9HELI|nr:UDP-glucose 4-epimerase GalE [Helicobacter winghamensis]EEO25573.1 UDP-glucose 4-epimerase [Helicobacter winghamensis ATCC BAA-430]PKT78017.1 UDP-glucose 4-epimerase GalE [Helicobacter winghamensis]PKT78280.1 UDP-glucose 4-epimerase GalE [Helicobacter winghamensis]PKT78545.1 UDP-glucose 4-epimerase GalE [Helicobacter winghamensis]PKT80126.1 UDP-glucose 4-epimerase GalE [Helicobacter winghamensis]
MQTFLFTGAAGYIGSHTAYYFLKNSDCKIVIFDNLSTGFLENIEFLQHTFKERVEFIQGDLSDTKALRKVFLDSNICAIIHFAASLIVQESVQKPLMYFKNNVANTTNLLEVAQEFGVNRFLFSSTAAVYGEPKSKENIVESSLKAPINPYGESKLMIEKILHALEVANPSFKSVILRYFNVAGALMEQQGALGQRVKNATHLIKVACECACGKRSKMQIFGEDYPTSDGTCIRDYIHIDDLASAHFWALKALMETEKSEVYNVGYGKGFSVKEVIDCVKKVSGKDFIVESAPRREGDPSVLVSDNQRILAHTSWNPKYDDLEVICKSAYLWEQILKKGN